MAGIAGHVEGREYLADVCGLRGTRRLEDHQLLNAALSDFIEPMEEQAVTGCGLHHRNVRCGKVLNRVFSPIV
ncbi:hypothetical protein D3C80_1185570 [compost metagenome]